MVSSLLVSPLLAVVVLLLITMWQVPLVAACGGFACVLAQPVEQSGEAIVFGVDGNRVEMHVQILYEGPAESFGWLLPMPFQPEVSVGSDNLFKALFETTVPTFQLNIENELSATCNFDEQIPIACPMAFFSAAGGGATVLEEGSVGPFDFVILEAAPNDPSSIMRWLEENEYQVPEGSDALINFYGMQDNVFVALKLKKDTPSGEIQPLILKYEMPSAETDTPEAVARRAIACVPIQLTSIAATDNMPIQVYVLGDARATPLNFLEVELDDAQVDWLGCLGNPKCYDDDYRSRFDSAANEHVNHTFVTEYAGPSDILSKTIAIDVTADQISSVVSVQEFMATISNLLPDIPIVATLLQTYLSTNTTLDAAGLAQELDEKVLQPALEAQAFVDQFTYLTRLYARLSPASMVKDPFFTFHPELPTVSNVHNATAIPVCENNQGTALLISVTGSAEPLRVPATLGCGGWRPAVPVVVSDTIVNTTNIMPDLTLISTARRLVAWGFPGDTPQMAVRLEDGSFDAMEIQSAIAFGDSLVINQTIPAFVVTSDSNTAPADDSNDITTTSTTSPPDDGAMPAVDSSEESTDDSGAVAIGMTTMVVWIGIIAGMIC